MSSENLPRCKFEDTPCFESAVAQSVRILKDGNRKINLIPLEPLHITAINIDTGSGNFRLKLDMRECDISGFTGVQNLKISAKSDSKLHWAVTGNIPKVDISGKYKADGQVLVLPVQGEGDARITLYDVDILLTIKEEDKRTERKGKSYMKLDQFGVKFEPKRVSMHFDNLFNGDKVLGDNLNMFINENWPELFKEIRPALEESLAQIFLEITNRVFNKVPADEVYLSENLPRCKFEDTPCFENAVEQSVRILKDGNRKINLIPLEPLHVNAINIDTGAGNFRLQLDLKDCDISGFTGVQNLRITAKSDNRLHWEVTGHVPKIEVKGKYKADGRVLVLPVQGEGDALITLYDLDIFLIIKEEDKRTERKGKAYMHLDTFDVKFTPKRVTMNFENLFNGDKVLGDNLNMFINENWPEVFKEVQPALEESLAQIFLEITNRVFDKVPAEEIYL
ncbi:circadian clock-controlled protein-like [Ctenocephalides felis]|uniref:circadian clock-controlled protein-like n=1 Tax=Ctenocephalides felis TaxID=7515 RepID=UPI000E6E3DE0|nr:circadian clock-controlled protein-like [Ctenocephalides felis]